MKVLERRSAVGGHLRLRRGSRDDRSAGWRGELQRGEEVRLSSWDKWHWVENPACAVPEEATISKDSLRDVSNMVQN